MQNHTVLNTIGSVSDMDELALTRRPHKRLVTRSGQLHYKHTGIRTFELLNATAWYTLLDLWWPYLIGVVTMLYFTIALLFAAVYSIDKEGIGIAQEKQNFGSTTFGEAFFFSFQTISTIGYGGLYPKSLFVNIVATIEAYVGLLSFGMLVALVFEKMSRANRLRHTIKWSNIACINNNQKYWEGVESEADGDYKTEGQSCLTFRFVNMRKRQICETDFNLLLMRKATSGGFGKRYELIELPYELNIQNHRVRLTDMAIPLLPLPWQVVHVIDEKSPLFNKTMDALEAEETEIIGVFDGIDELSSNNFQSRWSYLPSELRLGHDFEPMTRRDDKGTLVIEVDKVSRHSRVVHGVNS